MILLPLVIQSIIFFMLQISIFGIILNQTEFCQALYGDYQHKKKKKKFGETASVEPFEVTRADAGNIIFFQFSFYCHLLINCILCFDMLCYAFYNCLSNTLKACHPLLTSRYLIISFNLYACFHVFKILFWFRTNHSRLKILKRFRIH